jgi:hypothetical protein
MNLGKGLTKRGRRVWIQTRNVKNQLPQTRLASWVAMMLRGSRRLRYQLLRYLHIFYRKFSFKSLCCISAATPAITLYKTIIGKARLVGYDSYQ